MSWLSSAAAPLRCLAGDRWTYTGPFFFRPLQDAPQQRSPRFELRDFMDKFMSEIATVLPTLLIQIKDSPQFFNATRLLSTAQERALILFILAFVAG
ncbi:hypothetical protein C8Q77DRAFT_1162252 [Trametes polyzona]|nr:hypothetical protein C8Q77DRAFT_1162252 [Trametes polyzona]